MEVFIISIILFVTVSSAVMIWLSFPGSFVMVGFIFLWAWFGDFVRISITEIVIILGIMLFMEVLELVLGGLAVKYAGAGKRSAILAVVGGLLGTIILGSVLFILGAIVGLFLGSYLGAYIGERQAGKDKALAKRAALGALLGTISAKIIKSAATVIIGVWMIKEVL